MTNILIFIFDVKLAKRYDILFQLERLLLV